ncbi:MAG: aldose epimerase family protein [Hyphomicrobiales bacterium]
MTYGAILRELTVKVEGSRRKAVIGFDALEAYVKAGGYIGAIVGRYANRIAEGRFTLDGQRYQLTRNEKGKTHLHGGDSGFDKKLWTIVESKSDRVTLGLHSPAGEEGYPGAVDVTCTYRVSPPATLVIEMAATSDAPTIINLTGHSYFNLDGEGDTRKHRLMIPAEEYLPVSADLIPTNPTPVSGTAFDFREPREVGQSGASYDNTFIIARERSAKPRLVAELASSKGDVLMRLSSTEPGLQFYDGAHVEHRGLCLEPQCFSDTPNRPDFPPCVLRPGETYRHLIVHEFRV